MYLDTLYKSLNAYITDWLIDELEQNCKYLSLKVTSTLEQLISRDVYIIENDRRN